MIKTDKKMNICLFVDRFISLWRERYFFSHSQYQFFTSRKKLLVFQTFLRGKQKQVLQLLSNELDWQTMRRIKRRVALMKYPCERYEYLFNRLVQLRQDQKSVDQIIQSWGDQISLDLFPRMILAAVEGKVQADLLESSSSSSSQLSTSA